MNQNMINDNIRITLPPEFHLLDPEEKKKLYAESVVIQQWAAYDPDRHMVFSASWKQMNSILAMMACSMDGAKGLQRRMKAALRGRNYRFCEYFKGQLGDKKTFGFTFIYQGKEVEYLNRAIMVRDGGCIYYLASQIPTDLGNEAKTVMDGIWQSLSMD